MGFRIFRTERPRAFDYKPRYYDARRERLQALEELARAEVSDGPSTTGSSSLRRARMELGFSQRRARPRRLDRRQAIRTFVLVGLLVLVAYIYFRL